MFQKCSNPPTIYPEPSYQIPLNPIKPAFSHGFPMACPPRPRRHHRRSFAELAFCRASVASGATKLALSETDRSRPQMRPGRRNGTWRGARNFQRDFSRDRHSMAQLMSDVAAQLILRDLQLIWFMSLWDLYNDFATCLKGKPELIWLWLKIINPQQLDGFSYET